MDEGTPVWFRLTVDTATHRVLGERMTARARFVRHPLRRLRARASRSRRRDDRPPAPPPLRDRRAAGRRRLRRPARLRADQQGDRTARSTTRSRAGRPSRRPASSWPRSPTAATPAPAWQRAAADGRVSLDELRGTPLVVNFWASWCDPCRAEAKVLERGRQERGRRAVPRPRRPGRPRGRARLHRPVRPHVPARARPGQRRPSAPGASPGLPETYFLAADGRVVGHVIGTVDDAQLRDGIAAAKAGRPAAAPAEGGEQRPVTRSSGSAARRRRRRSGTRAGPRAARRRSPSASRRRGCARRSSAAARGPRSRRTRRPRGRAPARRRARPPAGGRATGSRRKVADMSRSPVSASSAVAVAGRVSSMVKSVIAGAFPLRRTPQPHRLSRSEFGIWLRHPRPGGRPWPAGHPIPASIPSPGRPPRPRRRRTRTW